jgi:hypothetical protein
MRNRPTVRGVRTIAAVSVALAMGTLVMWLAVPVRTQSVGFSKPEPAAFLQVNRCYRFTFTIVGTPSWKVLEVLEGGWVRAEADAGPASAQREAAWINTAQIVTIRESTCSA